MISTHQLIVEANALLMDVLISKKRILYAIRFSVWAPRPVARIAILAASNPKTWICALREDLAFVCRHIKT